MLFSGFKGIAGYRFVIVDIVNRGGNSTYNEVLDSKLRDKPLLLIASFLLILSLSCSKRERG